ncbi:MAG: MotA/TolQ/ExbB proton channel family protein [Verrucomicrobiales bacterium]|nr:MotA/TolQ/ExbB proton channel family protein [Verrucomicrobiales bacterium]
MSRIVRHHAAAGLLALLLAVPGWRGNAQQDLKSVATGASEDLKKALAELAQVRQQVESERVPLARELSELEQRLADQRAELAKAQRFQENQLVELNALKAEAKRRADEVSYVDSLLTEYSRAFRSRLNFAEEPRYLAVFQDVDKAAVAPDQTPAERLQRRFAILKTAIARGHDALGGEIIEGRALDRQGRVQQGKIALIGPVAMFADAAGTSSGMLQQELNKADPTVVAVSPEITTAARELVTTGKGRLALDPTLGNAFKLTAMKQSFWETIKHGGWVMAPLITLGVASLITALVKWLQLSRVRLASERDLQRVLTDLNAGRKEQALAHAQSIPGPAGGLLATAVEHADEKKEYIEEILYERILAARTRLERGLPFLALAATTGPLLGLLGTVMGMIALFKLISSFGSGDPRVLASGISEALIATASGMSVAIPSLLLHAFLSRKAKAIVGSMEQTSVGFINGLPENASLTFH